MSDTFDDRERTIAFRMAFEEAGLELCQQLQSEIDQNRPSSRRAKSRDIPDATASQIIEAVESTLISDIENQVKIYLIGGVQIQRLRESYGEDGRRALFDLLQKDEVSAGVDGKERTMTLYMSKKDRTSRTTRDRVSELHKQAAVEVLQSIGITTPTTKEINLYRKTREQSLAIARTLVRGLAA